MEGVGVVKVIRRWLAGLAALTVLLSGCNVDVESFLQPPRMQGEQQAVQQALETYLRDSGGTKPGRYTLKYPTEGAYTSAFVLCDRWGGPLESSASSARMALAFYALATAPEETHVNLLYRNGEEWVSMGDCVGSGTDIRQVAFGDLDGDGVKELLAGWSTYNSRDHRLAVYTVSDGLTLLADDRVYTGLFVGDMTATGRDSLVLLHIGSTQKVTASLEHLQDGSLRTVGTVSLDGQIGQFSSFTLGALAEGVPGLYVDALKSDDTTITELIYYDEAGLHAPFYDAATGTTTVTGRAGGLTVRDVDGDGQMEIPVSRPFAEEERPAEHITGHLTVWQSWDYATRTFRDKLITVANPTDGYLVVLDETRAAQTATRYDPERHTLELRLAETDETYLWLWTDGAGKAPRPGVTVLVLWEDAAGKPACTAWYDPAVTDAQRVRYMVLRLTE